MTVPHTRALGLPVADARITWATAALLFAYYVATMSRDLAGFDSPELALVAVELGLGHPTGQPLFTLLGHLFAHIPGLPPLVGLNALSALFGALCIVPASSLAAELGGGAHLSRRASATWLAHAVLLAWGTHAAIWESATRVEVYALAAFFALWCAARVVAAAGEPGERSTEAMGLAGVSIGLAATANPYFAVLGALAVSPTVLRRILGRAWPLRAGLAAVVGGVLGITPYAYVPLAAQAAQNSTRFVWGDPVDGARLRHYLLGLDYAQNRTITTEEWLAHAVDWVGWSFSRHVFVLVFLGLGATGYLLVRRRPAAATGAILFAGALMLVASNTVWEPDLPDYVSYFLPACWLFAGAVAAVVDETLRVTRMRVGGAAALAAAAAALISSPMIHARTRHEDHVPRAIATELLASVPPRGVLLVDASHFVAPLLYLQHVEAARPDVLVVPSGFASTSWFWGQALRRHPDLRPFSLAGEGGRVGRIARLVRANPDRAVRFSSAEEALRFGNPVCALGTAYGVGRACENTKERPKDFSLDAWSRRLGTGSPGTDNLLAGLGLERGQFLLASGRAEEATRSLLAGVPPSRRPGTDLSAGQWKQVGARHIQFVWERQVPIGEPARNLFVASMLLGQADLPEAAARCFAEAIADGLPEALRVRAAAPDAAGPATPQPVHVP